MNMMFRFAGGKTEEEARTMRCCGPLGCGQSAKQAGIQDDNDAGRYCIGSRCMAWRWTRVPFRSWDSETVYTDIPGEGQCGYLPYETRWPTELP